MDILKSISMPGDSPKRPSNGRRNFIWKIGGAMTAVFASAVPAMSKPIFKSDTTLKSEVDRLSNQLGILEDENGIRKLHKTYEDLLNRGMYQEVEDLFTDNAEVIFNGGVFKGRDKGVKRLFCDHFRSGLTGKRLDPAPGFQLNAAQQQDTVEVAPDRISATARFFYSIQVGAPMVSDSLLVKMARLHGEGIMKWWEDGTYNISYIKDIKSGGWKIERLEFRALSKADYRPGKSHAGPISVPTFPKVYPEDPAGPDKLIAPDQELQRV